MKASREIAQFKILPTDDTIACWKLGLDKRQLGLVREKGQQVDNGYIFCLFLETMSLSNPSLAILSNKHVKHTHCI